MKILAVDSVDKVINVALINDDKVSKKVLEHNKNASEYLLSAINVLLEENNVSIADLDYLGLNIGPGSFTGIRIAMSLFKGFMVSSDLKCITVNSFEKISYNINDDKYIVVLDSGTSDYYAMVYDKYFTTFISLDKDKLITLSHDYPIYSDCVLDGVDHIFVQQDENSLCNSILCSLKKGVIKNEYELEPLYVKKAQSEREYKQKFISNIKIENATENDLESIKNIEYDNFDAPYSEKQILDDIISGRMLVAKNNNIVVGYLSYLISDDIEILKICIEKNSRNFGIGQKLINKLDFYQKDIFLEVNENNLAKNFYAKIGFKLLSTRKKYYPDGSNALIMVKRFN